MSALFLSNDIMNDQISSNRVVFHATMAKAIQDSFASVVFTFVFTFAKLIYIQLGQLQIPHYNYIFIKVSPLSCQLKLQLSAD